MVFMERFYYAQNGLKVLFEAQHYYFILFVYLFIYLFIRILFMSFFGNLWQALMMVKNDCLHHTQILCI